MSAGFRGRLISGFLGSGPQPRTGSIHQDSGKTPGKHPVQPGGIVPRHIPGCSGLCRIGSVLADQIQTSSRYIAGSYHIPKDSWPSSCVFLPPGALHMSGQPGPAPFPDKEGGQHGGFALNNKPSFSYPGRRAKEYPRKNHALGSKAAACAGEGLVCGGGGRRLHHPDFAGFTRMVSGLISLFTAPYLAVKSRTYC